MNKLSRYIGSRVLRKRSGELTRRKKVQNFDTAQTAAVLFDADRQENFPVIKKFWKFLEANHIHTLVIGISLLRKPPEHLLKWTNFKILNRKHIKWYGRPKGKIAGEFFDLHPDILFKICNCDNLPMDFFVELSDAKFKVGYHSEAWNDLDLMINPVNHEDDVGYFVEQVIRYVKMMNSSN